MGEGDFYDLRLGLYHTIYSLTQHFISISVWSHKLLFLYWHVKTKVVQEKPV